MAHNILVLGGSRHIGYHAALRFLNAGSTVTFLLRSPNTFDQDEDIQKHVKSGKARLVKGDALAVKDIQNLWAEASKDAPVDLVLFTVGFNGNQKFSLRKGFVGMSPGNLVTQCLFNVLRTMPTTQPLPKFVALSTVGVTRASRSAAPLALKPVYSYLIQQAIQDKLGMERIIYHCAGWQWNSRDEPSAEIIGEGWKELEGLPEPGSLKDAMVIRAAMLTDGECKAPYRVVEGDITGYSVSRKDVGHFIFDAVTNHWEEYGGKQVSIAY
ncbi:hypothetical protein CPB84DRAFT_1722679 [Gymnopilus junonius]|uniref:NAD(P)-binding domain-containing protein n=1 Tax=Gymnopilus junonius TaxID=109634 RepID=A0A9P5NXY9_GYMJU|nr:hypothetical protein CPB84DRAFT_1722679 [Gymnopilus junonius]